MRPKTDRPLNSKNLEGLRPRTLSKSDFKLARTCATKLYYKELGYPQADAEDPYLEMLAEGGYMIEQLARLMFPEGQELKYGRDPQKNAEDTRARLAADRVTLFEATLLSGRKQARVDVLRKEGKRFELIEVKSKSFDGDDLEEGPQGPFRAKKRPHKILTDWIPYLEDVAYQTMVLRELYPDRTVVPYLLVVDKSKTTSTEGLPGMFEVRRGGERDLDVRFTGDRAAVIPGEFLRRLDVSTEVEELMPLVKEEARRFEESLAGDAPKKLVTPIDWDCRNCEFRVVPGESKSGFRECWKGLADPEPEIFDLYKFGSNKDGKERLADVLIANGRTRFADVDPDDLVRKNGSPTADSVRQKIQLAGEPWVGPGLKAELARWKYPLHFIDFETSLLAVPYHKGMRPYEMIAFQWSCHTLDAPDAAPRHSEWLNTRDAWPCLEFARTLRAAIGDTGTVLMWSHHERTTLRTVLDQIVRYDAGDASLRAWIQSVTGDGGTPGRLVDMNRVCLDFFFHPAMKGSTSIKVVLDALWKNDAAVRDLYARWTGRPADAATGPYEGLPAVQVGETELNVREGTGAMRAYQAMVYGAEKGDPAVARAWGEVLRRYCELDTMAMVLIWAHWRRIAA